MTISFLCHSEHGFDQAPYEAITQEEYEKGIKDIKIIDFETITSGEIETENCASGVCPVKWAWQIKTSVLL